MDILKLGLGKEKQVDVVAWFDARNGKFAAFLFTFFTFFYIDELRGVDIDNPAVGLDESHAHGITAFFVALIK